MNNRLNLFLKSIGPGLLFAGAAIGVSHLVQSTRAGADYGLGLLWVIFVIHGVKYPFFEFGPRYALATGENLIEGYKKLGKGFLMVFLIVTIGTIFTVQAAVTLVTAGIALQLFGLSTDPLVWTLVLLVISAVLLLWGHYRLLDKTMKLIILILSVSTLAAVGLAFGSDRSVPPLTFDLPTTAIELTFLIAFMGWMPAPLDLSVWHSIWAIEKKKIQNQDFDLKTALLDFKIGYWSSIILAVAFLLLGALVMFNSGATFQNASGAFAAQVIELYTQVLGDWTRWLVATAAFMAMFSTTLTCLDAQPRVLSKAIAHFRNRPEKPNAYLVAMVVLILGTLIILRFFISSMREMVEIATVLSFLTTPFFAIANYRLLTSRHTPTEARPSRTLQIWSWVGIVFLIGFGVVYLVQFFGK